MNHWHVTRHIALFVCVFLLLAKGSNSHAAEGVVWEDLETRIHVVQDESLGKVPARFGQGYKLEGQQGHLQLKPGVGIRGDFTIECWIRPSRRTPRATLFSSTAWAKFQLTLREGREIKFQLRGEKASARMETTYDFAPNRWYHVAVSYEQARDARMYVNGALVAVASPEGGLPEPQADLSVLGAWSRDGKSSYKQYFEGVIDRPRYVDQAIDHAAVQASYREGLDTLPIVPAPKQVLKLDTDGFALDRHITIELDPALLSADDPAVQAVIDRIRLQFNNNVEIGHHNAVQSEGARLVVVHARQQKHVDGADQLLDEQPGPEGYQLLVQPDTISVVAETGRGAAYGLRTLAQLVNSHGNVDAMRVWDYPTYAFRGALFVDDTQPPIVFADHLRLMIDRMAELKQNYLMIRSHDWLMLDDPQVVSALREIQAYAGERHVAIIPYLQSYSHAKGYLWRDLRTGQTVTVVKEPVILSGTEAVPLSVANVIITERTPVIVESEQGRRYEEGRDFTVVPGDITTDWRGHWAYPTLRNDNAPFKIQRKTKSRIADGETVLVTYDHASGQETTSVFSPYMWEMMEQQLRLTVELFEPEWVQLGMDEIWVINNAKGRMGRTDMGNEEIVAYAFTKAYEIAKQIDPELKVMLWSDMFDDLQTPDWYHPLDEHTIETLFDEGQVARGIHMMPWYYGRNPALMDGSFGYFLGHGFPVVPASGHDPLNNYEWLHVILDHEAEEASSPGLLYTVWSTNDRSKRLDGLRAHALTTWSADQISMPTLLELERVLLRLGIDVEVDDPSNARSVVGDAGLAQKLEALWHASNAELRQVDRESLSQTSEPGLRRLMATHEWVSRLIEN